MTGPVLRAGAWPAVAGVTGVAVVVGGCGAAFPASATMLLPVCFALLAAAAAFTLDEPASLVVDVTPTTPARRTRIRATALLAPLAAGDDGLEASRTPPCGQPHPPRRPTPFCLGRPVRSVDGTYLD